MRWPLLLLLAACGGCGRSPAPAPATPTLPAPAAGDLAALPPASLKSLCPAGGDSRFTARLRGALDADVDWKASQISCDGGMRPSGSGLRAALAGPATTVDGKPHSLRFIFGINLKDAASGPAVALPTNLTLILEGEGTLYATRGEDRCASEILSRQPLKGAEEGLQRLQVRGYCTGTADDTAGNLQLLVSTFEFTTVIRVEVEPGVGT